MRSSVSAEGVGVVLSNLHFEKQTKERDAGQGQSEVERESQIEINSHRSLS